MRHVAGRKYMRKKKTALTNIAYIKPANLTAAITQSGLTRDAIATAIKVPVEVLTSWEQEGDQHPDFDQASKLVEHLQIPLGWLFLSKPAQRKLTIPDKRSLGPRRLLSPNFNRLLSDALVRRDWYRQHLIYKGGTALPFVGSVSMKDEVVRVANDIRQVLRLKPEDRRDMYSWSEYMSRLSSKAEQAGIVVMRTGVVGNTQRKIERTEVQGFALADTFSPLVFVNSSDFVTAQIFTLAHELAHVWLGQSAINNPDEGGSARDSIETHCNAIATELLVPKREFVIAWRQTVPSDRLTLLVRRYWVSARVILRRARELNELSFDDYQALREDALAAEEKRKKAGGGSYYGNAALRAGHKLTDAVVAQVNSGNLPIAEGASLLAMNINTFAHFAEIGQ